MRSYVPLNEGIGGKGQQAKRHHKKRSTRKEKEEQKHRYPKFHAIDYSYYP